MPDTPDISGTWISLMRNGNFEDAWKFSDNILKEGLNRDYINLPRHYQSIWDGTDLRDKRVLVRCYHGLGDTIQFIRYIPCLRKTSKEVIVWAQPRLIELLKTAGGIGQLFPLHDGTPEIEYDNDIEIMELAHYFRTTVFTIPADVPYLHVEPMPLSPARERLSVGLVWQSGGWNRERSVPFTMLMSLKQFEGIDFYILQDEAISAGWKEDFGIHPGSCTLFEHARIISWLDLMITVDSMPAHLAGALNTPVWLMLNAEADWRWMENRDDSPWYPSMKLFRQEKQGDWDPVIEQIIAGLKKLTA